MRQRYSLKESVNRILRSFSGVAIPTDAPETLSGDVLSVDGALSDLAELFEGSLPGKSGVIPSGISLELDEFAEYGGIYNSITGTHSVTLNTGFQKVTGSFQANMIHSTNVAPNALESEIIINHIGTYFVGCQLSFSGTANGTITGGAAVNGVVQNQTLFRRKLGTAGDVGSASFSGLILITGTPTTLDFRARCDMTTKAFAIQAGQLWVYGIEA